MPLQNAMAVVSLLADGVGDALFGEACLAAPASFLSAAAVSHAAVESVWHFFMKLVSAAPASFLVVASALQLGLLGARSGLS
jgi:hypothetical protein